MITSTSFAGQSLNIVEIAILAKCLLEEAWIKCLTSLAHRFELQQIPLEEKLMLEEMYTSFFYDAYYAPVKTTRHIQALLQNTRRMLDMLKATDEAAWRNIICLNPYGNSKQK